MNGLYLKEVIGGVVHQHDESSSTDVVNAPGEADEEDGCHMVNYLLIEVLKRKQRRRVGCAEEREMLELNIYVSHVLIVGE